MWSLVKSLGTLDGSYRHRERENGLKRRHQTLATRRREPSLSLTKGQTGTIDKTWEPWTTTSINGDESTSMAISSVRSSRHPENSRNANNSVLDYLGVRPDHHRQGVGSMLVQSGVEMANALGLDIFLVAMGRKALGMYLKAGFELLDEASHDLTPYGANESYETFYVVKRAA